MGIGSALALLNVAQRHAWAEETPEPAYPPCTTTADEAALQAARGAFEAGKAAFNEADYGRAIIYWEDAFRRDCSASLLLKNLARAYEANAQYAHAVVALTTFLEREPNTADRAELETQVVTLKARTQPAAPIAAPQKTEPAPTQTPPAAAPKASSPANVEHDDYLPPDESTDSTNAPDSVGPIVLASVGAAVAVTGGVLWWLAHNDETKAEQECPSRMGCPVGVEQRGNDAIDRQLRWGLLAGGGLVLLSGGVAWYLLQPSESTALVPAIGPHFAGLELGGTF